jgi:hypothetical protein
MKSINIGLDQLECILRWIGSDELERITVSSKSFAMTEIGCGFGFYLTYHFPSLFYLDVFGEKN